MTKYECAIVSAYTGYTMLQGEDLCYLYSYLEYMTHRPVHPMEVPLICETFKDRIKQDFIELCRNVED